MKANKLFKTLMLFGLTTVLAGCSFEIVDESTSKQDSTTTGETSGSTDTGSTDTSSTEPETPAKQKEDYKFDSFNYSSYWRNLCVFGEGDRTTAHTAVTKDVDVGLPTQTTKTKYVVQDVKAFVVPVEFTDYTADTMPLGRAGTKADIEKAVFGDGTGTYHESLKSFYAKSSFGVCNVSGVVTDWYQTGKAAKLMNKSDTGYASKLAGEIYDYYTTGAGAGTYNMTDFDANHDGLIDSLIMIYTPPITTTGEIWWAFRTSAGTGDQDVNNPSFYDFFWCSYRFFYRDGDMSDSDIASGNYNPDAHTLIHEYGHVLSMPDYYVTDYAKNDYSGTGCLDMMDCNIGDHNSASKSWYGWVEPYVVDEDATIELNSTTDTGEYILIPIKGKKFTTLLDQYMIVEFLTPTGVAKKDGEVGLNGGAKYYSTAGVRIIHVDGRLGLRQYVGSGDNGSWQFKGFTTRMGNSNGSYVTTACSNTASRSICPDYKILEVLPATGKRISTFGGKPQNRANDSCLYQAGQTFGKGSVWANYMMHGDADDEWDIPFGYTISIDKIVGNQSATITIKKNAD